MDFSVLLGLYAVKLIAGKEKDEYGRAAKKDYPAMRRSNERGTLTVSKHVCKKPNHQISPFPCGFLYFNYTLPIGKVKLFLCIFKKYFQKYLFAKEKAPPWLLPGRGEMQV